MALCGGPSFGSLDAHREGVLVMDNHSNAIIVENLSVAYGRTLALDSISGTIPPRALMAVFGPNGGGKSTFVKVLASLLKPSHGTVTHSCKTTCHPAYLPQSFVFHRSFPVTVREVVTMGLWRMVGPFKAITASHQEIVENALARVGLTAYGERGIETLSGGQFQRMLFGRIIVEDSSLIILDEPFTAIDLQTSETLLTLIQEWHALGKTILVVLHDLEMARGFFKEAILLSRTCWGWGPAKEVLTDDRVREAYMNVAKDSHG